MNEVGNVKRGANMLQFTSHGHVLGFEPTGVYVAAGSHALHVEFVNALKATPVSESSTNLISNKKAAGTQKAEPLSKVSYANLWQGVTLSYDAPGSALVRSSYRVEPRANADKIRLRYNAPVSVQKDGSLHISFKSGEMTESAPRAWQERDGRHLPVQIAFSQRGKNEIAFEVGDHDRSLPLFIDPTLTWNTFLGGSGTEDAGTGVAVDGSGNVYVSGFSNATWGSPVLAYSSGQDAFAAKLDSGGTLTWNTFLGGAGNTDEGTGVAVDSSGNVYVTGFSNATWGSPVSAYSTGFEAFAAKLDSSGALTWNTFLGGGGTDLGQGVAADGSGNVYVTGYSDATWGSPVSAYSSGQDAFAAKLNSSGSLTWNTFLGGSGGDLGQGVAVDGSGNVYVTGSSDATWGGSPVRTYSTGSDAFAAKLDSTGSLTWNTFLGGSGLDNGVGIAVDGSGNVYVTGFSDATWGSPVRAYNSGQDAFAAKLDSNGTLTWNTFLGGSGTEDAGHRIAVDGSGNVYVTGISNATWGSPVSAYSSGYDAFAAELGSSGSLTWNTFLGGSGFDNGLGIAVDGSGNVYVTGPSNATWGSPVRAYDSGYDAFVAKIAQCTTPATPTITPSGSVSFCVSGTLTSSSATGNQWYKDGNLLSGETNQTYVATADGNYTVRVTDSGCTSAPSAATTVTINTNPPTPTITPGGPTTFCTGGSVTLTSSSGTGNQWNLNGSPIGGATNSTYNATASGNYSVTVTDGNNCSAISAATTVTVNSLPATPTITPGGPTTFCAGGSVTLTSSSASGNQWYLNGSPISGETNQTYNATASGSYTVKVTDGNSCVSAPSAATTVTVNPLPATPTITPGGPTTFCAGGSVTLTSSSATGNQWYLNGSPIGGETNQTYNATASGSYTVKVTDGNNCVSAASAATTVTVNPLPATPTITPSGATTFCAGGNVTLTSSSGTGNQWNLNGSPIGGATNSTYNATASGNYSVTVTDGNNCSATSATTTVTVQPTTVTVVNINNSGAGSLRQAILDLCAAGGTINFDPSLTAGGPASITLSSELVIDKNMTINGPTNSGLTISGGNTNRIFNINAGVNLSIFSLTIANGKANTGGGILNAGTLTITNSTINNNQTIDGADATGASNGGNAGNGGGIYNTGTLTLINSTVGGNQTGRGGDNLSGTTGNGGNSGAGAGIYSIGTVRLTNTTITDNETGRPGHVAATDPAPPGLPGTAGAGGGVFNSGGTLTINNTILANNRDGFGGEDDINGAVNSSSSFNLIGSDAGLTGISNGSNGNRVGASDSTLSPLLGPLADNGGPTHTYLPLAGSPAIDAGSNALAKDQSNIALTTDQRGAGFPRVINGTVEIGAVESTGATAPAGADLTVSKSADVDQVVPGRDITYTITVRNIGGDPATSASMSDTLPQVTTSADTPTFTSTTLVSFSPAPGWTCSAPSVGSGGTVSCTRANVAGSSVHTFTLVVHVLSGAVPNADYPFITNTVSVSAANDPNTENDSGAASTLVLSCITNPVVTTSADSGAGSLRQAIADACAGSTITFDMTPGNVTSPITLTTAELPINKNLTVQGPGANLLTVQRSAVTPNFRIFNVTAGTVNISGLTISNGSSGSGGGIRNRGTLTLTGCTISGNTASVAGGGVQNDGSNSTATLNLINSTVSGNTASSFGAGIMNEGFQGSATLNIINSTISGNSSPSFGGGIYNDGNSGTATLISTNSTISGNTASSSGGGIYNFGNGGTATLTVRNTILSDNKALNASEGPDIFNFNGTVSGSYNVIQTSTGYTISGSNNLNVDPMLEKGGTGTPILKNNGGPTQTHLLLPGSPAINAGSNALLPADTFDLDGDSNTAENLPVDQRGTGFARVVNTTVDIGAVEVNYAISATAGTPQSTSVNTAFATALKATVTESDTAKSGVSVTFTAPASGASGTFPGSTTTAVVSTDSSGIATAPTFTANAVGGSYNVVASIGTGQPTAAFALTNNKLNQTINFGTLANKAASDPDFTVSATATSGLTVGFVASGQCTITGTTVHLTGPGFCTITAQQAGNAQYNAAPDVSRTFTINSALLAFNLASYSVNEGAGFVTIRVDRTGDVSVPVAVDYATNDFSGTPATDIQPAHCEVASPNASSKCDYTTAGGRLRFAASETFKTIQLSIVNDVYQEGDETLSMSLSNPSVGSVASPSTTVITIQSNDTTPPNSNTNPYLNNAFFVRQQYLDFLLREPDTTGYNSWLNILNGCNPNQGFLGAPPECDRVQVSSAFFRSPEFGERGYWVYRFFTASLGRRPLYAEFTPEMRRLSGLKPTADLAADEADFINGFMQRPEFTAIYNGITDAGHASAFISKLEEKAGVTLPATVPPTQPGQPPQYNRQDLIDRMQNGTLSPAQTLRAFIEQKTVWDAYFFKALVAMEYFGYLRRDPEPAGYNDWVDVLTNGRGTHPPGDYRHLVFGFIYSEEYRERFGVK
jgi:hypothetical protein